AGELVRTAGQVSRADQDVAGYRGLVPSAVAARAHYDARLVPAFVVAGLVDDDVRGDRAGPQPVEGDDSAGARPAAQLVAGEDQGGAVPGGVEHDQAGGVPAVDDVARDGQDAAQLVGGGNDHLFRLRAGRPGPAEGIEEAAQPVLPLGGRRRARFHRVVRRRQTVQELAGVAFLGRTRRLKAARPGSGPVLLLG